MKKFTMTNLYSYNELYLSLYLESEETLFVVHTERSECAGTPVTSISG
ncbi:hypothetical protein SAMN05216469_102219 [Ruminococcus albus]|jgi:hypothetical protein|uniref:Uncharacterized protein n=1 Tax=Ruminococcus albus TaxID=1264 RepID=A0A1H7GQD5_RUMAL|nr:hypothetical protein SAMN05216469_102219 [Ruminococcus albus]